MWLTFACINKVTCVCRHGKGGMFELRTISHAYDAMKQKQQRMKKSVYDGWPLQIKKLARSYFDKKPEEIGVIFPALLQVLGQLRRNM
ncbi:hypothetical protein AND_002583 [Anopheles darlingi]|uniref:Uncharacterized protein n=1 Tax=Anopheles darlingi TaxID=43151 RepID=W5JRU3_ANODA|nr:hypothetical protein AND_002583 [Anopheles darlingi]